MLLVALIFLGPSFIQLAAAGNQCFGADDGGGLYGILYNAVREYMSQDCANNKNCAVAQTYGWPMNSWCVGDVTDMHSLFSTNPWVSYDIMATFNEDISGWDTSSVTEMYDMFGYAPLFNGDLSAWDTSSVENMYAMFANATSFNGDLSSWDISSATNMLEMFYGATSFNQDLCAWRDKFPYDPWDLSAAYIFEESGCTFTDTPQEDQKGPFCASDCNGYNPSAANTPKPSGAAYFTAAISPLMILLGFMALEMTQRYEVILL